MHMNIRRFLPLAFLALSGIVSQGQTLYVSTAGDDTYPGSIDSSFKTIAKAVSLAVPGTTIYVRQGTYPITSVINIPSSGTVTDTCRLLAYPGERAVIDGSAMPVAGNNRGIALGGSYWHLRGLDITRAGDNGMRITGSHNVIENCSFSGNFDTGLQLDNGASLNRIINCDSYGNADLSQGNADGFAPKLGVGTGNAFFGCRAWQNSDDGWDGYLRGANEVTTTLDNCWCFQNGYLGNGDPSSGNGNGFKLGGSDSVNLAHNMILTCCLAFDNRVKGFDQNNNRGSMTLVNCTAYRNGTNYAIALSLNPSHALTLTNCIALGFTGSLASFAVQSTNSWNPPFVVTDADFQSMDTTGVRGARKSDGSLPDVSFLHLAAGSDLIDGGTMAGIPYFGLAPDLGAFESVFPVSVRTNQEVPDSYTLFQNHPNPFNLTTRVRFAIRIASHVRIALYDLLGREVALLLDERRDAGVHEIGFDAAGLASGAYFYRLQAQPLDGGTPGMFVKTKSLILLK